MGLCVWSIHPANMGDRLQADFALFLTAMAFKLFLTDRLPTINYLTIIDIYILVADMFLALATLAHVLVSMKVNRDDVSPLVLPPSEEFATEQDLLNLDQAVFRV